MNHIHSRNKKRIILCIVYMAAALCAASLVSSCGSTRDSAKHPPTGHTDGQAEPGLSPERPPLPVLPEPSPEPAPEPRNPRLAFDPVHVRIPAILVDAAIQGTGYDDTETMEIVPSASIISWLKEGPIPGNDGNAILGGHNRWKGDVGQLFSLDALAIGDKMEIGYADGSSLYFCLESVFVYPLATADADRIMDLEGDARVTVITCKDPFNPAIGTSDNRIVAVFKEESVFSIPDPPVEPWPPVDPDKDASDQSLPDHTDTDSGVDEAQGSDSVTGI